MTIFADQILILGELVLRLGVVIIGAFALWCYIVWRS